MWLHIYLKSHYSTLIWVLWLLFAVASQKSDKIKMKRNGKKWKGISSFSFFRWNKFSKDRIITTILSKPPQNYGNWMVRWNRMWRPFQPFQCDPFWYSYRTTSAKARVRFPFPRSNNNNNKLIKYYIIISQFNLVDCFGLALILTR